MYLTSALAALAMAGEVDEAKAGLERVIAAADRSGDRLTAAGHRLWRGLVHYEAGELLLAEQDLILEPIPFWQASTPLAYRAGFLTQVLLERGAIDEAEQLIADTSLDDVVDAHRIHFVYARGRLRLESGAAEGALADFMRGRGSGRIGPVPQPCLRPVAFAGGDCAAAARASGRGARARARGARALARLGRAAHRGRFAARARPGRGWTGRRAVAARGGRRARGFAGAARARAGARRPGCVAAARQQPQRGAEASA